MSNPDHDLLIESAHRPGDPRPLRTRPIFEDLGAEICSFDLASGRLVMAFSPSERHLQGGGVVAGGVVGTMLDFAMSMPVLGTLPPGTPFATTNFSVNLISVVKPGRVLAEGTIDRRGSRVAFTSARMFEDNPERRLIATATSTLMIMQRAQDAVPGKSGNG